MKPIIICICLTAIFSMRLYGQGAEAQQLLLNVEKLDQLKNILKDMKEGFLIVSKGYNTIKNITKGSFSLHDAFLGALLKVSPAVKKYKRVADIIAIEFQILKEYKSALKRFKSSNLFNPNELKYMEAVYSNLFKKSIQNLDELAIVITSGKLRMSDDERIEAIDRVYANITEKLVFLQHFNDEGSLLAVQRGREMVDTKISEKVNGF